MSTLLVIAQPNPIHSVLFLIASFLALAGVYLLLDAPFVAVVQLVIHGGALTVLCLFIFIGLNAPREDPDDATTLARESTGARAFGVLLAIAMAMELMWALNRTRL